MTQFNSMAAKYPLIATCAGLTHGVLRIDCWRIPRKLTQALDLYGGTFLPEDQGESWSVATRERLRGKFIHALSSYGQELEKEASPDAAIRCYQRGMDADPIVEEFHMGLMRCYERLGRRTEAISVYRRMKQTLSVVLGVPPSEASQMYFQDLLNRQVAGRFWC